MKEIITAQLRLIALKAIAEAERQGAVYWAANSEKLKDKSGMALDYIKTGYAKATASIPGLKDTTIDDALLEQAMVSARDWAWGQIGHLVDNVTHGKVTDPLPLPTINDDALGRPATEGDFGPSMSTSKPNK